MTQSHYLPLLPPPRYLSQLQFEAQMRGIGQRLHTHLIRKERPGIESHQPFYDDYSRRQAEVDKDAVIAAMWWVRQPDKHSVHKRPIVITHARPVSAPRQVHPENPWDAALAPRFTRR